MYKSDTTLINNDCVFDTSTYTPTIGTIKNYNQFQKIKWNSTAQTATTIFENGDTLVLHIGGCIHYSYSATLYTSINFSNQNELLVKTSWIATTFFKPNFNTRFEYAIKNGLFKQENEYADTSSVIQYSIIEKDTLISNEILNNIIFTKQNKGTKIEVSGYIN
ncbi:MAG: hypothetical protein ABL940_03270 [Bacteroidia bacterium]